MNKGNNTKLNLIGNWLYKVKNKIINEEILLFFVKEKFSLQNLAKCIDTLNIKNEIIRLGNISNKFELTSLYLINNIDYDLIKNKIDTKTTNIILISSNPNVITSYLNCTKSFIFFDYSIDPFYFINKNTLEYYSSNESIEKNRIKYYLEQQNPILLIKNDYKIFEEYLLFKLFDSGQPIHNFLKIIIQDTKYEKYLENNILLKKFIIFELSLFKEKNILTSSLAIILYKISTLDLKKNKTYIGNYYRENLGIKSKNIYNLNRLLKDFDSKDIEESLSEAKIYDLNQSNIVISNENQLKIRIAKRLLLKNELKLTYEEIQEITELSSDLMNLL